MSEMTLNFGGGQKVMVKNKTAAPVQITAEQILREAVERQQEEARPPTQRIVDDEELQQYRVRKRKEYEDILRRSRHHIGTWIKYAQWEAAQKEFLRARSVFERALQIDYQNISLWLKYVEMEMRNKFINSARNIFDRVCLLLPRVDTFWLKYAHMEELLGNFAGARNIYERWMKWEPEHRAWLVYIKFEERCSEIDRCRNIFERYISCHPCQESFLRYTKFEERHKNVARARAGFEKAIEVLPQELLAENFYIKFADFEERHGEKERAKVIYEEALKRFPKSGAEELYRKYIAFQKQHGERESLEEAIWNKRRLFYEEELRENSQGYDAWFDLIRLEETVGNVEKIRDTYERAIANVPPILQKKYWKRYIYLWINYALFEEMQSKDTERCRKVFQKVLEIIPHEKFSFSKIWIFYAEFEIRQLDINKARKIYGRAIAECSKGKIFLSYASLELRLGNIDRCRKIYAKYIELHPFSPKSWIAMIDLEVMAEETERARALCELGINMERMDMPELIWKSYIDMEINASEIERARHLYERLLQKTQHFKVFKGFAEFEYRNAENIENARNVLQQGIEVCKRNNQREERAILLEYWLHLEREHGDQTKIREIFQKQPKKVKRKRHIVDELGNEEGIEEYMAYVFPDDEPQSANLKILEAAKNWMMKKMKNKSSEQTEQQKE